MSLKRRLIDVACIHAFQTMNAFFFIDDRVRKSFLCLLHSYASDRTCLRAGAVPAGSGAGLFPDTTAGTVIQLLLYLIPYFIVGHDVVRKCLIGIKNRQLFDESFLMTLATIGAFGCKEFGEAVAVMLFYQVGEFFQGYAVGKSRGSIADLMSMAPDFANREAEDGSVEVIDPDDIEVGDILVIKPGEKVPTDGPASRSRGW